MFYSLGNVMSVPTDILFLRSFDSFHMKGGKIHGDAIVVSFLRSGILLEWIEKSPLNLHT